MASKHVCRIKPVSKTRLSAALSAAWGRVSNAVGRGKFADDAEFDVVTINRAMAGPSLPSAEHLLNSLAADHTALQEVMALYGLKTIPLVTDAANDMELAAGMGHALSEFLERLKDGKRCHIDTAFLAPLFREVIPQMEAIIKEDDERRAA